jgi:hypothetical protein
MGTPKSSRFRGVTLFRPTGKWRAQISASGKTTSLGDHDTEEEAARAFDRAAINIKGGTAALINFDVSEYADEVPRLVKMSQAELVAELRARARKAGRGGSKFRGVTLLKATGQWHAQFNLQGKHLHLGFFDDEVSAARAADIAALFFAEPAAMADVACHVPTNLPVADYPPAMITSLREMTLGQLVERTSGTALIKTDVQTEEDVTGEDAPVLFQYVDIKPPTPPPHTVPASSTISTARSGGVLFPVKKRLAPNQLAEVLCPRSKERRTRMAPCRAAC